MNNQNMNSRRGMPCGPNMSRGQNMPCSQNTPCGQNVPCGQNTPCGKGTPRTPNRSMPRQNSYVQGMRDNVDCNVECKVECRREEPSECGREPVSGRDRRPVPDRKVLMKEIYQVGFALVEIVLYLDTHPCDADALNYYNQIKKRHHMVMEMYEREYGPLLNCNVMNDNYWSWVSTPMPWEVEEC